MKKISLMFPIEIAILGGSPIFGNQNGLLVIFPFLVLEKAWNTLKLKYVFVPGFSLGGSFVSFPQEEEIQVASGDYPKHPLLRGWIQTPIP